MKVYNLIPPGKQLHHSSHWTGRTCSLLLSPTKTMNDLWFFLTLFLMRVGIRGSSCLRMGGTDLPCLQGQGGTNGGCGSTKFAVAPSYHNSQASTTFGSSWYFKSTFHAHRSEWRDGYARRTIPSLLFEAGRVTGMVVDLVCSVLDSRFRVSWANPSSSVPPAAVTMAILVVGNDNNAAMCQCTARPTRRFVLDNG